MESNRSRDAYPDSHGLGELRERLIVIETKLDHYNEIRTTAYTAMVTATRNADEIRELKGYATANRECAAKANGTADAARDDIAEMKESQRWLVRSVVAVVFGFVFNLVFNLVQGVS